MSSFSDIYIVDASILIGLYKGEILEAVFRLPFHLYTTDLIIFELKTPKGKSLLPLGLEECSLDEVQVIELGKFIQKYKKPSMQDLSCLVLAQSLGKPLLTKDNDLKKAAKEEGVQVHDIIWLLEVMIQLSILTSPKAAEALNLMLKKGEWLPQEKCAKLIRKWRKEK